MQDKTWMLYGANGYTGKLIAEAAVKAGMKPVLAGRNKAALDAMGEALDLEVRVFDLKDLHLHMNLLDHIDIVLNCAGPYSSTAEDMIHGCLDASVHYLDITGEIDVFEFGQELHDRARDCGVVICPGVGFDVIPTDSLAASLKQKMPDATSLVLGFDSRSGFSPGTAKTSVEGLAKGGRIRRNGRIETVPLAYETRKIDFGDGEKLAMTIPWGDVSTAYFSTRIPDIKVFIPASPSLVSKLGKLNWIRPLLGLGLVQRLMKRRIEKSIQGPAEEERQVTPTWVWGEVSNEAGQTITGRVQTENGYSVTVSGALMVIRHLMQNDVSPGYHTPTTLMGAGVVESLPGSSEIEYSG